MIVWQRQAWLTATTPSHARPKVNTQIIILHACSGLLNYHACPQHPSSSSSSNPIYCRRPSHHPNVISYKYDGQIMLPTPVLSPWLLRSDGMPCHASWWCCIITQGWSMEGERERERERIKTQIEGGWVPKLATEIAGLSHDKGTQCR